MTPTPLIVILAGIFGWILGFAMGLIVEKALHVDLSDPKYRKRQK